MERGLLSLGALALVAGVPVAWSWLVYGSGLSGSALLIAGIAMCLLVGGIGAAMIRLLDSGR
jgi:hypothetical protein